MACHHSGNVDVREPAHAGRSIERAELRERTDVFEDRAHAGRVLAELMAEAQLPRAQVLAIPAGGVPVAAALAQSLGWALDVAVVSKITLPWNTEAGYGAVAFDGSVLLNDALVRECALSPEQVDRGVASTRLKVQRRCERLRRGRASLSLAGSDVVLVDDGLASGFTMLAAVAACRAAGAAHVSVAVPTGHVRAIERLRPEVDTLVCANVRGGARFAVADAYVRWADVPEVQAELQLEAFAARSS